MHLTPNKNGSLRNSKGQEESPEDIQRRYDRGRSRNKRLTEEDE